MPYRQAVIETGLSVSMPAKIKILITGKNGQVGSELQRALAPLGQVVAVDSKQCNFLAPHQIRECVRSVKPDIMVNAAAYTAVDLAETHKDQAFAINAEAPRILAEEADRTGATLIHYSTDYVFNGKKEQPYTESDAPDPLSVYGHSKLAGEEAVITTAEKALVLRTSWVFGVHGKNFAKKVLELAREKETLKIVSDQFGSPTAASLIADATAQIIEQHSNGSQRTPYGLYHLASAGKTTWYEYAKHIVQYAARKYPDIKTAPENVLPLSTADYPVAACRPKHSVLSTEKLRKDFGLTLPDWKESLDEILSFLCAKR